MKARLHPKCMVKVPGYSPETYSAQCLKFGIAQSVNGYIHHTAWAVVAVAFSEAEELPKQVILVLSAYHGEHRVAGVLALACGTMAIVAANHHS